MTLYLLRVFEEKCGVSFKYLIVLRERIVRKKEYGTFFNCIERYRCDMDQIIEILT